MKKSANKAPAAKPAAKPAVKPAAKATVKKAPAKKAAAPAKAAPARKATLPPDTFVSAQIDIGFGNHLYIRGEGPGLSWDHGFAMDNTGSNLWTYAIKGAAGPVVFKVLVNDLTWSTGSDYVATPGKSLTITPTF